MLQCVAAVLCSGLQWVVVCCCVVQCAAMCMLPTFMRECVSEFGRRMYFNSVAAVSQCVAVCRGVCSVLPCSAVRCSALQCVAVCCSALQWVAVGCGVLQCVAVCCSVLHCAAVCCIVLQCVAVCCSVLQCIAVCCSDTWFTNEA